MKERIKLAVRVSQDKHYRLSVKTAKDRTTIQKMLEQAIDQYLEKQK